MRKEHIRQQEVEAALTGQSVVEPSVAWVREQLAALERISRVCSDADAQHQYGIVYALRFDPAGFASLERHGGMGIISKTPISPDRIVAKVIIPRGLERPALCEDKERLKREDLWA